MTTNIAIRRFAHTANHMWTTTIFTAKAEATGNTLHFDSGSMDFTGDGLITIQAVNDYSDPRIPSTEPTNNETDN